MKKNVLCIACLLALATTVMAGGVPKIWDYRTLNINNWKIVSNSYGLFVFAHYSQSGGTWRNPAHSYIYAAGLWVGGLDSLDTARVSVAHNGAEGCEYVAVNPYTYDWVNFQTDSLARLYLSTDSSDLAAWPLKDSLGNNVIKSQQDGYAVYSDQNPAHSFSGPQPGVRIKQHSYAWNNDWRSDMVFFVFTLVNVSGHAIDSMYVGPCIDGDVGYESGSLSNDRTDFDISRSMVIQYQTAPEPGYDSIGQFGCRILKSPINNMGYAVHVRDTALSGQTSYSHDIAPGQPLGLTAFKIITIDIAPSNDRDRYKYLAGITFTSDYHDAYDEWGTSTPGDKRYVMSSGPFNLAKDDSITYAICVLAAYMRDTLLTLSDSAQAFYDRTLSVAYNPATPHTVPTALQLNSRPNPSRFETLIEYQLPTAGPVKMAVYNIAGQYVRTLVNARQAAGAHSARWNGDDGRGKRVSSGVYFCKLQAGGTSMTKRIMVIK